MPTILLGVDGGGTSTRAVLIELTQAPGSTRGPLVRELGRGEAPSCNSYSMGSQAALSHLLQAARGAFAASGLEPDSALLDAHIAWGLGLAGAVSDQDLSQWRELVRPHLAPDSILSIGEDALAAQSGAFAGGPGAIMIGGTGANAFGRNAQHHTARADGLGPLLGDRGSGYWIGQQALRSAASHHDGILQCPLLHREVLAFFRVADAPALLPIVYAPTWTKDRAAALAPLVSRAAEHGDEHASTILEAAGTELAHTARAVLHKLQLHEIAPMGGVLEHIPAVARAFEAALRATEPQVRLIAPRYDAAVGAALLAWNQK